MNTVHTLAAGAIAMTLTLTGCASDPAPSGERPGVVVPSNGQPTDTAPRPTNAAVSSAGDLVLAEIGGVKLTEAQFKPVLYKAYGLDVLLKVVQLNMAKADAANQGVTITPADVQTERKTTLEMAFGDAKPEDYPELLKQLLSQQRVSEAEFDVVMEVNTYLRAMVRPIASRDISEETVLNEFNSLYGERVVVREIAVNNMQDVTEIRRLLALEDPATGQKASFEEVARLYSKSPSAENGGLLPRFARTSPNINPVFANAAFALKVGEVSSDPVQDRGMYHILKLEQRLPPEVVKFEDVRDSVREELIRRRENGLMAAKRTEMAQRALRDLRILEPGMKAEFETRLEAANPKPVEKDRVLQSLEESRKAAPATAAPATSEPTSVTPAQAPATPAAPATAPPATATPPTSQPK